MPTSLATHDRCYAWGPNVFVNVEWSYGRGYWGIHIVVYSPQRVVYWQDTLGM